VRRELNAEPPLAVDQHAVPLVVRVDRAAQQTCPEGALGGQIGGVEHDDLPRDLHAVLLGTTRYDASALQSIDQFGATPLWLDQGPISIIRSAGEPPCHDE